jgi:predicted ester cyclase
MSTQQNKAIARRRIEEGVNHRNMALIDEILAPTCIHHFPGHPPLDRDTFKQVSAMFHHAFPDLHETIEDEIAEGDKVVQRLTSCGTHQGEFQGISPTGKRFTVSAISIVRIEGDKIVEMWSEFDALGLMQQLGVIPAPAQA